MEFANELILQNAAYEQVVSHCLYNGISMEKLCIMALNTNLISANYIEKLGKHVIQTCEQAKLEVPEEAYELISNALLREQQTDQFCWVSYAGTLLRILNPYSPMVADMDGDYLGLRLWEAEICALEWMEQEFDCNPQVFAESDVLEIGCGVSLAAFAALERMHANTITLCDYNPRVMDNLQVMVERKNLKKNVNLVQLDWNKPQIDLSVFPSFIIAADCVYDPNDIPNFIRTLNTMLQARREVSRCLLVCSVRNPKTFQALELELSKYDKLLLVEQQQCAPARYSVNSTHMMTKNWKREEVVLWMLQCA